MLKSFQTLNLQDGMLRGIANGIIIPFLSPDGYPLLGRVIKPVSLVDVLIGTWSDSMITIDVA